VEIGDLTLAGSHIRDTIHFRVAVDGPSKLRSESTEESTAETDFHACDGTDQWMYHSAGASFYRSAIAGPCGESRFSEWAKLLDNLVSAEVLGRDQVQSNGILRECQVVRGEYEVRAGTNSLAAISRTVRTMCIDTAESIILRDHLEMAVPASSMHSTTTITYNVYQRDPEFSSDTFQAPVPTGTFQDPGPYLGEDPVAVDGVYRTGGNVTGPELIYNAEPSYTEEARTAGISGTVLLSLIVDADREPRDVGVVRGLDSGLDEKALEVVRTWRFRAGMRNGTPVAVGGLIIAVSFLLK
jgi:TonB family protein